jgi:hypothetical protein
MRNFSSMFALVAGIESPEIAHLEVTYSKLPQADRAALLSMSQLMEWRSHHEEYRKALRQSNTAVPYLGNILYLPRAILALIDQFRYPYSGVL